MAGELSDRVSRVRAFNRFYTRLIGILNDGYLGTPWTVTEARVLYELASGTSAEVVELRRSLGLDAGYLSRILSRFETSGLVTRHRSRADARRQMVELTAAGRSQFTVLNRRSAGDIGALLSQHSKHRQLRVLAAMDTIRGILDDDQGNPAFTLRAPCPGDYGWVVQRHGALYADEHGWDESFEALVARIVADYHEGHDPGREAAWIAEIGGDPVGCVFCVRKDDNTAQLRLLLVEPHARGLGIGTALIDRCLRFARRAGYGGIGLWTNDVLIEARRLYERAGFRLVEQEQHHSFGADLVGQNWVREL